MLDINISRRVFIGAAMFTVSAPLLAAALNKKTHIYKVLNDGQYFNAADMTLLTDLAEIMIPKTDTPGAKDAHVMLILDGLMLTWAGTKTKQQYQACISQIKQIATNTYQDTYTNLSLPQRTELVTALDKRAFENPNTSLSANYRKLKEMIFHVYYTSEEVNPDFVLIPGGYRGSITKKELEAIQARGYL